jgi:hypothetical protein
MPAFALRDLGIDRLGLTGDIMFDGLERGMIIAVDTISFPFVGEVDGFGETFIRLKNAVKILWDGRHGEYAAGKPPTTAEIEKTYPLYTISADAIIGWGRYPGGKIPEPR